MDSIRSQAPNVLLVDSGDLLAPILNEQGELKGEVLARAYRMMGYDAVALGELDLFFGPRYLSSLTARRELPFVSINVASAPDTSSNGAEGPSAARPDSFAVAPYFVKQIAGVRIAVVGMLNHRVFLPSAVTDSFQVANMEQKLEELLPEIESRSDLIVALAHCGSVSRAQSLARRFPKLDVVVAGHVGPATPEAEEIGEAVVVYTRTQGRYMGVLNLLLDRNKKVIGFGHELVPMSREIPDDPEMLGLLTEYVDRLRLLVKSSAFRPTAKDLQEPPAHYVTAAKCAQCHPQQEKQWRQTGHARAFASLVDRRRDFDPECQKCHTTGFRFKSGFITPRGTPQFKDVQCEACHGPGADHVKDPRAGYGKVEKKTCEGCHTPHNSPEFEYESYLRRVKH